MKNIIQLFSTDISQSTKSPNSELLLFDFRDSMCNRFTCFSCGKKKELKSIHGCINGYSLWSELLSLLLKINLIICHGSQRGKVHFSPASSKTIPLNVRYFFLSLKNSSHPPETNKWNEHPLGSPQIPQLTGIQIKRPSLLDERTLWKFSQIKASFLKKLS